MRRGLLIQRIGNSFSWIYYSLFSVGLMSDIADDCMK